MESLGHNPLINVTRFFLFSLSLSLSLLLSFYLYPPLLLSLSLLFTLNFNPYLSLSVLPRSHVIELCIDHQSFSAHLAYLALFLSIYLYFTAYTLFSLRR